MMNFYDNLILLRLQEAYRASGDSKTNFWQKQQDGLMVSTVKCGTRGAGVFKHEIDSISLARAAGYTDEQLRELVKRLEQKRAELLHNILSQLDAA
jgi:prophage regulatory protein